jgi:hypothetical protein
METTECIVLRSDRAEPSEYIAFHYCDFFREIRRAKKTDPRFIMFRFIIRATSESERRKESSHSSPAPMPRRFRGLKR